MGQRKQRGTEEVLDAMRAHPVGTPRSLAELEARLLQSVERLDGGKGVDGRAILAKLKRYLRV